MNTRANRLKASRIRPAALVCWTALCLLTSGAFAAEATNAPSGSSMEAFKIIPQRNIFNANRRPGFAQRGTPPRPPKTEAFSLLGTLHDDDGGTSLAFFEGTESQFKKVLKPGEAIGGCKIVEITPDSVKLEADDAQIDLPMGMQMKRQEAEKWQLVVGTAVSAPASGSRERSSASEGDGRRDRGPSSDFNSRRDRGGASSGRRERRPTSYGRPERSSPTEASASTESATKSESGAAPGDAADEILKRMMQNREKELSK